MPTRSGRRFRRSLLNFSGLGEAESQELLDFLDNHLGQEIGLIDWEQRYWRGVVMTPEEPVTEDSRGRFSASFQFEGELDETWSAANRNDVHVAGTLSAVADDDASAQTLSSATPRTWSVSLTRKTAIDGTRYIYVKRKDGRRKLKWTFRLTRNKSLELRAFLTAYFASQIRVTDHRNRVWVGNFVDNPFELTTTERAGPPIPPAAPWGDGGR